jgi:hypothetical protein
LVAALSGSADIGAYSDKLQAKWVDYFEKSRTDPKAKPPTEDRVETFEKLLERAEKTALLTPEQRADILKLNEFRDDLEHVKPRTWSLEVGGLPRMGANAAKAVAALLPSFSHRLELDEIARVEEAVSKFEQLGLKYPSRPPHNR